MTKQRLISVSKTIAHALRHKPETFGLTLDAGGWVELSALLTALSDRAHVTITEADIREIISTSEKKRFELKGGHIRATYGHSISAKIEHSPAIPPDVLYHGTSKGAYQAIKTEGIKPMGRQYVHLSSDCETAVRVGRRSDRHPVVLVVDSKKMYEEGFQFFHSANDGTWMCEIVPEKYISVMPAPFKNVGD